MVKEREIYSRIKQQSGKAMAERAGDSNMELLVDLGDDRSIVSPDRRPSLKESVHSDSLLAPDADFMTDDRSSAASGLDVADRLTYLEQRMQMQEDEIQLLKMALADVLKRLNITEEHQASAAAAAAAGTAGARRVGGKARPVSLALPSRASAIKKSSTAPSSGAGRTYSPTPSSSSVRSPPCSVKDSPCKSKTRPASAASSSKKSDQEGTKPKEAAVTLGTRRVTHCKVTMQIYLSPLAKKTGCPEVAKATVTTRTKPATTNASKTRAGAGSSNGTKVEKKKSNPSFTLNLQKTSSSVSSGAPQETSSYPSPVKSPSQYFQICY